MKCCFTVLAAMATVLGVFHAGSAAAQSTTNGRATTMWGTGTQQGATQGDSAAMHANQGIVAAQSNAAKAGLLLGTNISITSIGTQNIVSINGDNNTVNANQNGQNSGNISNGGRVRSR